jgi:hypothetical protein
VTLQARIVAENAEHIVTSVAVVSTPTKSFNQLAALHGHSDILALHWILGEVERLESYSDAASDKRLFSKSTAFNVASDDDPSIAKLTSMTKQIRGHYNFDQLTKEIMNNRDLLIETCAPVY